MDRWIRLKLLIDAIERVPTFGVVRIRPVLIHIRCIGCTILRDSRARLTTQSRTCAQLELLPGARVRDTAYERHYTC
jgi:hypothetical protein